MQCKPLSHFHTVCSAQRRYIGPWEGSYGVTGVRGPWQECSLRFASNGINRQGISRDDDSSVTARFGLAANAALQYGMQPLALSGGRCVGSRCLLERSTMTS